MNLNISPNPLTCADRSGGVNAVVFDHAVGFLNAGHYINSGNDGLNIAHAIAQVKDLDIFHCHGLYPIGPDHFPASYSRLNDVVLQNALRAKITVCISEFSANLLRHKLHINPIVTRNGIFIDEYPAAGDSKGPVLFPKTALDANAKPDSVLWLKKNSNLNLLSVADIPGVKSLGNLNRPEFLHHLRQCSIYLGTTKENNSMAAMEAMISGVPIVGYDFGFAAEWLENGIGCELVEPDDYPALLDALQRVQGNWKSYSKQARAYAERFDWQPVIDYLLRIYEQAAADRIEWQAPKVSIIIPCHNYGAYVGQAIESALAQSVKCEVIVIDDCSSDNSYDVIRRYTRQIIGLRNSVNLGVAETRNKAIRIATGDFIVCLDADDRLKPDFVEKHLAAFRDRSDAIAYAPIDLIDLDGKPSGGQMFKATAMPTMHKNGRNQIPSCCMFRRIFWERAGGYESRYTPAEDAHLWLKIFALGGLPKRAANEPLMEYRVHKDSLSSKGFPNWWLDLGISYNQPIMERDPEFEFVIDGTEGVNQTLWSLESQMIPNWEARLETTPAESLSQTFPWLNQVSGRAKSRLRVKAGEILPASYLSDLNQRPAPWIDRPRLR